MKRFDNLTMRNIADNEAFDEVKQRLAALDADTARLWGTMTPAQMLMHCRLQIGLGTGAVRSKPMFPKVVQWLAKQSFGFRLKWKRDLPTAPAMVATTHDGLDISAEREALLATISDFIGRDEQAALSGHPIFGNMSKAEWGRIIYKHLDHHLRQFGV